MSSVGSRTEYPNRVFSSTPTDDPFDESELLGRSPRVRRQSSYEEMNGYTSEGQLHQYEDPRGLVDQVRKLNNRNGPAPCGEDKARPRKKMNDLYERCRTESEVYYGSEHSQKDGRKCGALCLIAILAIILSLGALALSVMIFMGVAIPKACHSCNTEEIRSPDASTSAAASATHLIQMIKELEGNVTLLRKTLKSKDAAIRDLLHSDNEQNDRILKLSRLPTYVIIKNAKYNVSKLVGPQGPRGYNGSQGPHGLRGEQGKPGEGANFSSCVYGVKSTAFTPSAVTGHDVALREPTGWKVMAATCATVGAAHSNLRRLKSDIGVIQYNCQCRGIEGNFPTTATCFIHYWLCPA